jgi:phosphatidylinositol alpha-mannosyltransferase
VAPNTGGESFGIVLVEAMAAGAAVVASDLEAFRAVCNAESDEPAGALFRTGDASDLARVLNQVLDDGDYRRRLVRNGVQRAQMYDWDHVAAAVMQVYETVQDGTKVRVKR